MDWMLAPYLATGIVVGRVVGAFDTPPWRIDAMRDAVISVFLMFWPLALTVWVVGQVSSMIAGGRGQ